MDTPSLYVVSETKCKTSDWIAHMFLWRSALNGGFGMGLHKATAPPQSDIQWRKRWLSTSNTKKETEVSLRLTNFVLLMYHQLTSEQRSQISALLQNKTPRKEIAKIVGISQSTLSRELKRNSCHNGQHYSWRKDHEMALERRERICRNRMISQWVMKKAINILIDWQWSPEQISAHLKAEDEKISHETIYAIYGFIPNCMSIAGTG